MSINAYQTFHEKNLGILIFPYLSERDKRNLEMTNKCWHEAKVNFEILSYQSLKTKLNEKKAIFRKVGEVLRKEELLSVLGSGGSKVAIEISDGKALLLPNMNYDSINWRGLIARWKMMLHDEIKMSQLLTKIGLLNPLHQKVSISLSENFHEEIQAYISVNFVYLKDCFILDTKNFRSCTWKLGKDFLFKSEEDRLIVENWEAVLDTLLTDIAKICVYQIPAVGDSLNLAIVRKSSLSSSYYFEIRYFGFDFSNKYGPIRIPKIEEKPSIVTNYTSPTELLNSILSTLFFYEFGRDYDYGKESEKYLKLQKQLVESYSKIIALRMEAMNINIHRQL